MVLSDSGKERPEAHYRQLVTKCNCLHGVTGCVKRDRVQEGKHEKRSDGIPRYAALLAPELALHAGKCALGQEVG